MIGPTLPQFINTSMDKREAGRFKTAKAGRGADRKMSGDYLELKRTCEAETTGTAMRRDRTNTSLAFHRGVFQPFDYKSTARLAAILVGRDIEKTSGALLKSVKGKEWHRDVYDKPIRVEGPFYNPFQLRGHSWTTIVGLLRSGNPPFSYSLAQTLSSALKTKTIFFCYEKTSSIALLLLFQNGELAEVLVNDGSSTFEILNRDKALKRQKAGWPAGFYFFSKTRKLKDGSLDQRDFGGILDEFFRLQDAWLAFDGASSVSKGLATFSLADGEQEDVLRVDLVSLQPARILPKAQIRDEQAAKVQAEMSNQNFTMAMAPASALSHSWTQTNRRQAVGLHRANLKKLQRRLKRRARADGYELWQAAKYGNEELAVMLIEAGVDLDVCPHGSTALETAIERRHVEIALALIKAGASLDKKGKWSGPPLLLATARRQTEVVRAMIDAGADVNVKGDVSCGEDVEELERVLTNRGVTQVEIAGPPLAKEATALIVAVRCGYPELIRMLLKAGADLAVTDKDGKTALDWAKTLKDEKAIAILQLGNA